jgi:hypothetical protein
MHGVHTTNRTRCLRPILKRWISLNRMFGSRWTRMSGDAPWWYNERALLGVFVGAVWQSGEEAFEEYSEQKRRGKLLGPGRIDLWFSAGSSEFWAEAKSMEIPLTRGAGQATKVNSVMEIAKEDASRLTPDGYTRRLALVFGMPYLRPCPKSQLKRRLRHMLMQAREVEHDAIAWIFPDMKRLPKANGWVCPGIILWVKEVYR